MKTSIIAIGNSQGLRIPKVLLQEGGITKEVEIKATRGGLKITPAKQVPAQADTVLLSERSLGRDWARPEEDAAWADL